MGVTTTIAIFLLVVSLCAGGLLYLVLRVFGVTLFRPEWMVLPLSWAVLIAFAGYLTVSECSVYEANLNAAEVAEIVADDAAEIQQLLPENLALGDVVITVLKKDRPLHWWQTLNKHDLVKYNVVLGSESEPRLVLLGLNRCGEVIARDTDF